MIIIMVVVVMMLVVMMRMIQDLWFCGGFGGGRIGDSEESQVQD